MTIFKVYKNRPFRVKLIKDRYWDYTVHKTISADTAETVDLVPYAGVDSQINYNASAPLLFINAGTLPDYSTFEEVRGCLLPEGRDYLISSQGYYDLLTGGKLDINYQTGKATGFSTENYIKLNQCLTASQYDLIIKAYFDGEARAQTIWYADGGHRVGIVGNKLGVYVNDWTLGTTELDSGVYWFRAIYDGTSFKLYQLADGDGTYTLQSLPEIGAWTEEAVIAECAGSPLESESSLLLSHNGADYWGGIMYLDGSHISLGDLFVGASLLKTRKEIYPGMVAAGISCDGQAQNYNLFYKGGAFVADVAETKAGYRWCGSEAMAAFSVGAVLKKNFTEYGKPVFAYPHMSGFASDAYILSDKDLLPGQFFAVNVKIICKVRVTAPTSRQTLCGIDAANGYGFGINNKNWRLSGSTVVTGGTVEANTVYWLQVVQEQGVGTKLYYLPDNGTYTLETLPDAAEWSAGPTLEEQLFNVGSAKLRIGCGFTSPNEYWRGDIDLMNTCVYVGGTSLLPEDTPAWMAHWTPFS